MSRKQPTKAPQAAAGVTGKFYCVGKSSHLLYQGFEIEVKDGVVVAVKCLSRAPDMAATAVGACTREMWVGLRTQEALNCD